MTLLAAVVAVSSSLAVAQPATTTATRPPDDPKACPESEQLKKNVQQLTAEVQRLKTKVIALEKERTANSIQEQLEREEQRGEQLQLRLIQIAEKEAPLLSQLDQLNQQLRPENIERALVGIGSVHPEDMKEDLRRRLQGERQRVLYQLELFRQDRARTQASLATTDAAIARLKMKLAEALRR
jgi:hypothetical protein